MQSQLLAPVSRFEAWKCGMQERIAAVIKFFIGEKPIAALVGPDDAYPHDELLVCGAAESFIEGFHAEVTRQQQEKEDAATN